MIVLRGPANSFAREKKTGGVAPARFRKLSACLEVVSRRHLQRARRSGVVGVAEARVGRAGVRHGRGADGRSGDAAEGRLADELVARVGAVEAIHRQAEVSRADVERLLETNVDGIEARLPEGVAGEVNSVGAIVVRRAAPDRRATERRAVRTALAVVVEIEVGTGRVRRAGREAGRSRETDAVPGREPDRVCRRSPALIAAGGSVRGRQVVEVLRLDA